VGDPLPDKVVPMKAVLTDERFSDPEWAFERKLDGIRAIAIKGDARVRLLSRNDLSLDARFPEVVAALEADPATHFVADGEIVAFDGAQTSFETLQQRGERKECDEQSSDGCGGNVQGGGHGRVPSGGGDTACAMPHTHCMTVQVSP